MTKHFCKTACAILCSLRHSILPPLVLAADFIAVLTVSILVLWLIVVMPVRALAQEQQQPAFADTDARASRGLTEGQSAEGLSKITLRAAR